MVEGMMFMYMLVNVEVFIGMRNHLLFDEPHGSAKMMVNICFTLMKKMLQKNWRCDSLF